MVGGGGGGGGGNPNQDQDHNQDLSTGSQRKFSEEKKIPKKSNI